MTTFMSFKEALAFLKVSKSTLYKMTSGHQIPFYKPKNGLIYFKQSELEDWLERGRIATNEEITKEAAKDGSRLGLC